MADLSQFENPRGEPDESGLKLDDLPQVPFDKIFVYLSLHERIGLRAVSRKLCRIIDGSLVESLFLSGRPADVIYGKSRLIRGAFVQNFIHSPRFELFFDAFGPSILSNLKRLRLCELLLNATNLPAFGRALNSFDQLQELHLIGFLYAISPNLHLKLNLPRLTRLHLEELQVLHQLTLDAPKLHSVKMVDCYFALKLELVHPESVETLMTVQLKHVTVKSMKNLKSLYIGDYAKAESTLVSDLKQLKEIYVDDHLKVRNLFDQKEENDRFDLKIYLRGLLLNGEQEAIRFRASNDMHAHMAENLPRLADEIPFCKSLSYTAIERTMPGSEISFLSKFTDLDKINVNRPVQSVPQFLDVLKSSGRISELVFHCSQPLGLFERLPDHCAVQKLTLNFQPPPDFGFILRLRDLIHLDLGCAIGTQLVRQAFEQIEYLSYVRFEYFTKLIKLQRNNPKKLQYRASVGNQTADDLDLDAAIKFIDEAMHR